MEIQPRIETDTKFVQPLKESDPMLVTLFGMVTEVRQLQPEKAEFPMLVTLDGILIEVRPEQPQNAMCPMFVTPSGMVIEDRMEQPSKALFPMLITPEGMTVLLQPFISVLVLVSIIALQLLRESYVVFPLATVIEVNNVFLR